MGTKTQMVIMAEAEQVDDLDKLRIVMNISRAEAARRTMSAGLSGSPSPLHENRERIGRLAKVASQRYGMTLRELVSLYATVYSRHTYGATLEQLESGEVVLPRLDT